MIRILPRRPFFPAMLLLSAISGLNAQVLPVGTPLMEEHYRREQLLGKVDSSLSLTLRPLSATALQRRDVYNGTDMGLTGDIRTFAGGKGLFQLQPVVWNQQTNTAYPYGWNDGSMIPARGYQTQVSAGFFASYKFISVQFRPEFVYARNPRYQVMRTDEHNYWRWYRGRVNIIDMPEHFGDGPYRRFFPGQSSVRLNWKGISAGFSTENLWWGPGRRNSLLMSNTAPGFFHATLNTIKPIRTAIGSFEGQLIAGLPQNSGYPPRMDSMLTHIYERIFYRPLHDSARYMSGFMVTYQPKWLPGLHLGVARSFVAYRTDVGWNLRNLAPFLSPAERRTYIDHSGWEREDEILRSPYGSVFFRWVMPKGRFEVYGEYGRSNKPKNGRDWMIQPDHSRAYILGFTKLVPLSSRGDLLEINAEATELAATTSIQTRFSPSWYTHNYVRHGYTHLGQVMGAGIGPGSNVQSVQFSWVRGLKQAGLMMERLVHNEDYFTPFVSDIRRAWADLGLRAHASWDFKQLLATASVSYMHAYNYQNEWYKEEGTAFWDFEPRDKTNFSLRLGLMYRF